MKSFKIVPIVTALATVDYLGGELTVPANHTYVAMTKLDCSNGETKGLLVSYEVEPRVSNAGYYVAVEGTEHTILGEVEYQDPRGSLRKVQGHTPEEAILANAEEVAIKMQYILESDSDSKIEDIFCPEHGVFAEFMHYQMPMLKQYFDALQEEEEEHVPGVHVVNATGKEIPEEIKQLLMSIFTGQTPAGRV